MPVFSTQGLAKLNTCHPDLIQLFKEVVQTYDCKIYDGHRGQAAQDQAYKEKRSEVKWPNSKHNKTPSLAVDVLPYPISLDKLDKLNRLEWCQCYHFIGFVLATAKSLGIKVRAGGDWNGNLNIRDQNFYDLPHWELIQP
jgi:peptidoglycan L-alanyl-D-glutamate endopeptidase CwlK